jgi:hypothetical protein
VLIDGAENPVGIAKDLKAMRENGEIQRKINIKKMYVPKDPNTVTIVGYSTLVYLNYKDFLQRNK